MEDVIKHHGGQEIQSIAKVVKINQKMCIRDRGYSDKCTDWSLLLLS